MRVAGVVLAGGRSSRMGRTKALIEIDGVPMGAHVLSTLRLAGCDPVFVYGGDADELAVLEAPIEHDLHPGAGPVGAVAGVLALVAEGYGEVSRDHRSDGAGERPAGQVDGAVIVACDLPDLDVSVIRALTSAAEQHRGAVIVAMTDRIEPLCSYWPVSARLAVVRHFDTGTRALHRVIGDIDAVTVEVPAGVLRNVNTPADLD